MSYRPKRTSIVCVTGIDDGNESAMEVTELHVASPLSDDAIKLSAAEAKLAHMTKEREIFLRSALQLLDKREHNIPQKKKYKNPFKFRRGKASRKGHLGVDDSDTMMDVIRFGSLRKANRFHRGIIEVERWKRKFIELRHGMFSYENENIKWLRGVKKKVILLSAQTCKCRVCPLEGEEGNKVFELTVYGGPRRLWLADSVEDRDAWVKAINTAMSGSAGDSGAQDLETQQQQQSAQTHPIVRYDPEHPVSSCIACAMSNISASVNDYCSGFSILHGHKYLANSNSNTGSSGCACEGAAAPYADDISRYTSIQSAIRCAMTAEQCRDITCAIVESLSNTSMTIPVLFVKRQMNCENFAMSTQDSLTAKTLQSVTSSQVWKDLQRDSIRINDVLISGETEGPEGMIGCLVRTILDKAELIRRISKDYHDHLALRKQRQQQQLLREQALEQRTLADTILSIENQSLTNSIGNAHLDEPVDGGDVNDDIRGNAALNKRNSISFPAVLAESDSDFDRESVRSVGGDMLSANGKIGPGEAVGSPGRLSVNFAKPARAIKEGLTAVVDSVIDNINSAAGSNLPSSMNRSNFGNVPPPPPPLELPSSPIYSLSKPPAYLNSFEITEGQVLACARDLLVLCNRTQSGGDTYFAIDALLCNHEHCILTPVANEHEMPLEITVDIVEGQARGAGRQSVKTNRSPPPVPRGDIAYDDEDGEDARISSSSADMGNDYNITGNSKGYKVSTNDASGLIITGAGTTTGSAAGVRESESSKSATSSDAGAQSSPRDEVPTRIPSAGTALTGAVSTVSHSRPLSTGSLGSVVGGAGGLVASRLPGGGPVTTAGNGQFASSLRNSIYSNASSMDRVMSSTGHNIHSATTSVSGEDNSSSASVYERTAKDSASVVSTTSNSDRMLIPLTAKSLQQMQHRPGVAGGLVGLVGLPPAVDISSVNNSKTQQGLSHSAHSASALQMVSGLSSGSGSGSGSAPDLVAMGAAAGVGVGAGAGVGETKRTLTRSDSDLQSQSSRGSNVSLQSVHSGQHVSSTLATANATPNPQYQQDGNNSSRSGVGAGSAESNKGTPASTTAAAANFLVEDDDCMSPFLRKPQFPYAVSHNKHAALLAGSSSGISSGVVAANKAQLALPPASGASTGLGINAGQKLPHQHRHVHNQRHPHHSPHHHHHTHQEDDEECSSSSSSCESEEEEEEDRQQKERENEGGEDSLGLGQGSLGQMRRLGAVPRGSVSSRGTVGLAQPPSPSPNHFRDDSSESERSRAHSQASLQANHDPLEPANPPSNDELEAASGEMSNYVGGSMCIRVQVRAVSKYRLCTLDPQDEMTDTWATVTGEFEQCFFIKSNCNGRPAISDRLVKLSVDKPEDINVTNVNDNASMVSGLTSAAVSKLSQQQSGRFTPRVGSTKTMIGASANLPAATTITGLTRVSSLNPPALPPKPVLAESIVPAAHLSSSQAGTGVSRSDLSATLPPVPTELTARA